MFRHHNDHKLNSRRQNYSQIVFFILNYEAGSGESGSSDQNQWKKFSLDTIWKLGLQPTESMPTNQRSPVH